jgi:hypothetical protein
MRVTGLLRRLKGFANGGVGLLRAGDDAAGE